ncbi:NADH dehydrogenase [ubiquinone] 1 beta subcomplex subunit 4-like [Penaeus indicus]|uniref:NADH dehydrogenase [ubiquinone] 1 beta subcomplex subunit 4-like n=1 Tax=Penaeus indicus TaxID=29960 RepID=UPI00300CEA80
MAGGAASVDAAKERAAVRAAIKKEFQKQITNPHRHGSGEGGVLFDPAVQRFMSMRATRYDHFKPSPRSSLIGVAMLAIPILGYGWWMKTSRENFEAKCRTGQVAYADREFKFA